MATSRILERESGMTGKPAALGSYCVCGAPALTLCGTGGDFPYSVHCLAPVCKPDGRWCEAHRHMAGTMGYGLVRAEVRAEFNGFSPDAGFVDRIRTFFWNRMPVKWKLKKLTEQFARAYPSPAPLPKFVVIIDGELYTQKDGKF